MQIVDLIMQILISLVIVIPLVVSLIKYVKKAIEEKNWTNLLKLVLSLCAAAEDKFSSGADKKEWVMAMVKASADTINYNISEAELSKLIDDLIELTNKVNIA